MGGNWNGPRSGPPGPGGGAGGPDAGPSIIVGTDRDRPFGFSYIPPVCLNVTLDISCVPIPYIMERCIITVGTVELHAYL